MKSVSLPVAVTGMGVVCPLGDTLSSAWDNLLAGADVFSEVTLFDTSACRCHIAAHALPSGEVGTARSSRATRMALPAARQALTQAGLLDGAGRLNEPGIPWCVSTTGGAMLHGEAFLRGLLEGRPHLLPQVARYQPQQQVLDVQAELGATGPAGIVANACASGANALGQAADLIRAGLAERIVVGGFEALSELIFAGFDCLQATSVGRCRPFDRERDGLLLGEAAAFFVVEHPESARRRGADILAHVAGYGQSTDLFHLTRPQEDGAALVRAMRGALQDAGLRAEDIAYVNAHGTGTDANDPAELRAFQAVFGESLGGVRISSTKAAIGHTLGAAGAVEAFFAIQSMRSGRPAPQLTTRMPLEGIENSLAGPDDCLPEGAAVASVNLGFGGSNACLIFTP